MIASLARPFLPILAALCLAGCGDEATLPVEAGIGPNPELPAPVQKFLPTVRQARTAPLVADDVGNTVWRITARRERIVGTARTSEIQQFSAHSR